VARVRPRYTWRFYEATGAIGSGGALTFILNTIGSVPDLKDLGVFGDYTIRRVIGKLFASSTNPTENTSVDWLVWGLIVADRDAVAGGTTPDPRSDAADWFGFGQVGVSMQGSFSSSVHPLQSEFTESRAMRKVNENNQDVIMRVEASTANIGSITVDVVGRLLVSH